MLWLRDDIITDNNIINDFVGNGRDIISTTSHFKLLCVGIYRGMNIRIRNSSQKRI